MNKYVYLNSSVSNDKKGKKKRTGEKKTGELRHRFKINVTVVHGHFCRYFTFSVTVTFSVMNCSSKVILNDRHRASQFGQSRE